MLRKTELTQSILSHYNGTKLEIHKRGVTKKLTNMWEIKQPTDQKRNHKENWKIPKHK